MLSLDVLSVVILEVKLVIRSWMLLSRLRRKQDSMSAVVFSAAIWEIIFLLFCYLPAS